MRLLFVKMMLLSLSVGLVVTACTDQPNGGENNQVRQHTKSDNGMKPLEAHTNEPAEVYGPWGMVGMERAKRRYPNAEIVDYQHIGRQAAETFRYELQQNGRQWTVHAVVTFDPQTNQVVSVELLEEK